MASKVFRWPGKDMVQLPEPNPIQSFVTGTQGSSTRLADRLGWMDLFSFDKINGILHHLEGTTTDMT